MRNGLTFFILLLMPFMLLAQENPYENAIQKGIELHDVGEYQKAIEAYKKAVKINKKRALAYYELSLSYYSIKDFKKASKYAQKAIKYAKTKRIKISAYLVKAAALDDGGNTKKAIKVYKKAIKTYPVDYLLYYNVGFSYYKVKNLKNAEKSLQKALTLNPTHPTSHLLLAYVMGDQGMRAQALMALSSFLFLENREHPVNITSRSKEGYNVFLKQSLGSIERKDETTININLFINENDEFSSVNLLIPLLQAANQSLADSLNLNQIQQVDLFMENLGSALEEHKTDKQSFWTAHYVEFFKAMKKEALIPTFTKMMQLSTKDDEVISWINENKTQIEKLETTFNTYYKLE